MDMTPEEYREYVKRFCPPSPVGKDCCLAFVVGGLICLLGQGLIDLYGFLGAEPELAGTLGSMTLVLLSVILTGFSLYDDLAKHAGAGTLVPITGFANAVAAPAIEFRSEGIITGTCVKLFSIAGPVLVFGITASTIYGLIYWICTRISCL